MSLIIQEQPSGAVNGSNKTFLLLKLIYQIESIFVDGIIYKGQITIDNNQITLDDAPTVSIFVDYYDEQPSGPSKGPLITKEIPVGPINGVNTIFALINTIFEIDHVWVDGTIYLENVSIVGNTITLNDAPITSIFVDYYPSAPPIPALGTLITKEVPSGLINSSNKSFFLSQIPRQISNIYIDGPVYNSNFLIVGKQIILDDAPTASIFVDYFTLININYIGLQKPKIIELLGYNIRIQHPDVSWEYGTSLKDPAFTGDTFIGVLDNNNFSKEDYFIIGQVGDSQTEEAQVNDVVVKDSSIPITNTLAWDHEVNAPIMKIVERAIKIYGANVLGAVGTLLESVSLIQSPIQSAVPIQWDKPFTEYTIKITDIPYLFYYVTFWDGITESQPSEYVPATGYAENAVASLVRTSLDSTDTEIDNNKFTWEMVVRWLQLWQDAVTQFSYEAVPGSGRFTKKDWPFEIDEAKNYTPILMEQNQDQYDLSSLNLKYQDSNRAIIDIKIGDQYELIYRPVSEFRALFLNKHRTTVSVQANPGDTILYVANTSSFQDTGSIVISNQIITYTGKTQTSFTGIPSSGTGSITSILSIGLPVWQNLQQGIPRQYTILQNVLYLDRPPDAQVAGKPLQMDFYKKLTPLRGSSNITPITFINTADLFLNSKIEQRKGNMEKAKDYMEQFKSQMIIEAQNDEIPTPQSYTYYEYDDYDRDANDRIFITQ